MATRTKTIEYSLGGFTTNIAGAATVGAAVTAYPAAMTIGIAETQSRIFKSVYIEWFWRASQVEANTIYNAFQLSTQLGAASTNIFRAWPALLVSPTDRESGFITQDLTSYFNTNFGSATTQTIRIGISVSSNVSASGNLGRLSYANAKLYMTYNYDDAGIKTVTKTVRIPIASHNLALTNVYTSMSLTGNTPPPDKQIPALSTFLPEGFVGIQTAWIEILASDNISTANQQPVLSARIDNGAVGVGTTRIFAEGTITGAAFNRDLWFYDTVTNSIGAAHSLYLSDNSSRFEVPCALMNVTYFYDQTATTTVINSLVLPIDTHGLYAIQGINTIDNVYLSSNIWIEDDNPILKQSGFLFYFQKAASVANNLVMFSGTQNKRNYVFNSIAAPNGLTPVLHRIDYGGGWALTSKMNNELSIRMHSNTITAPIGLYGALLYLNYTSNIASANNENTKSTSWILLEHWPLSGNTATTNVMTDIISTTGIGSTVMIADTNIRLVNSGSIITVRGASNPAMWDILHDIETRESFSTGYYSYSHTRLIRASSANRYATLITNENTNDCNMLPTTIGKLDYRDARGWRAYGQSAFNITGIRHWATFGSFGYAVTGRITNSSGGNLTIGIYNTAHELLNTVIQTGDGAFSTTVYSNSAVYVIGYESGVIQGVSNTGIPAVDSFDLSLKRELSSGWIN